MRSCLQLYARCHYDVLGVSPNASVAEIKARFRSLAKQWHPDCHAERNKPRAEAMFQEISSSYKIVLDEKNSGVKPSYVHRRPATVYQHRQRHPAMRGPWHGEYGLSKKQFFLSISGLMLFGSLLGFWPYYVSKKDAVFVRGREHILVPHSPEYVPHETDVFSHSSDPGARSTPEASAN
uniref:J domain-containing protein n=2 Tax=Rhodosorus marinus TaxID=101924 RepID=A0A7S3A401_9RHOD